MTVTSVEKDLDSLTMTVIAEFDAPVAKVWELWSDPRKLERWWGPPTYPGTVEEHNLVPGGRVTYYMTSPEGEKHRGWWKVESVDVPTSLVVIDGFADQDGNPVDSMPTSTMHMELIDIGGRTRMEVRSVFGSREQMEQVISMGVEEGIRQSMGQMDALLAA